MGRAKVAQNRWRLCLEAVAGHKADPSAKAVVGRYFDHEVGSR